MYVISLYDVFLASKRDWEGPQWVSVGELWGFVGWTNLYLGPELVYPHRVDSSFMLWDSTDKPTVCYPQKTLPGTQNGKTANRPRWVFIEKPQSLKLYPLWACIGMLAGSQHNDWWSHSTGW